MVAILFTGTFFITWDHYFTALGVWRFNPDYILGIYFMQLPLEEWLFFFTVPFACVFIYEALNYFIKSDPLKKFSSVITILIIISLLLIAIFNTGRLYTFVNFLLTAIFLGIHWLVFKKKYLGKFYLTYLVHLIPFFIVNGILTSLPVVLYNDQENLGLRLFTIPVEDTVYSFLLLLMNITIYEYLKEQSKQFC